jgi:hypothetical protein
MRTFSSVDCLSLWEAGSGLHPLDQGLLTLGAALPETSRDTLADWPLGRRNAALARLRCSLFGPRLEGWTACQLCGEKLEVEFDARLLAGQGADETPPREEPVVVNGRSFRLATTRDLAQVAREVDASVAAVKLAERCLMQGAESAGWSEEELEKIGQELAMADPLAETRLALRCPACENQWEETLEITTFLWREVEARARRLLMDVHTLASAYGWAERDIFSMSERRRAIYVEMANS